MQIHQKFISLLMFFSLPAFAVEDSATRSYSLGVHLARTFSQQGIVIQPAEFSAGLDDTQAGRTLQLDESTIKSELLRMQYDQQSSRQSIAATNRAAGEKFLAENKARASVTTLPSGLQYEVVTPGTGATPTTSDMVTVHYRGTLIDGTEFDSSYRRGKPISFPVSGVIRGWTEALLLMKAGCKWNLYIPSNLAYGAQGAGAAIGPDATLIFEVELLSVGK